MCHQSFAPKLGLGLAEVLAIDHEPGGSGGGTGGRHLVDEVRYGVP